MKYTVYKTTNLVKNDFYAAGGVNGFTGRRHADESKAAIGTANSIAQRGERNSQHGTCWVHHLDHKVSKKIPASERELWEAQGWASGRKIKW
jgi:hypothetical protein